MNGQKFIWAFLVLLLLSIQARAADKIVKETLDLQGRKRTYYIFVPSSVKAGTSVPLIVLLHGSRRNGLSLVEKWKELASQEGLIIVGPDSHDSQVWATPIDGPDFIHDLVETLKTKYPINPRRIYLFGHSAGAVFAINLTMMESEYFAATAVHAGSWQDKKDSSIMDYAKRKPPLAIFVGDRDAYFPLSSVKATEAALKGRGFPVELTVIKGHDHWYYDRAPEINRNAWEFLKRHELNEDPTYVAYSPGKGTDELDTAVNEIDALMRKANELAQRFYAKEGELRGKDNLKEKDAVTGIARAQRDLLIESASVLREAALKAERVSKSQSRGNYPQYFSLIAQINRKRAEAVDAMRERAELLLSDEPPNVVATKRNEAADKVEKLNKEVRELEQRAERIRTGKDQ